jgi:hypothetical protein
MRELLLILFTLGLTSFGHDVVTPKPKLLQKGIPLEGLSGREGTTVVFKFIVPPQAENVVFRTTGGKGDLDLYARHNVYPTRDDYDAASRVFGTKEEIRLPQPEEGIWYVLLDAYTDYTDVQLSASYAMQRGAIDLPRSLPSPGVFAGSAVVQLKCPTKGAVIRFTTDESEPAASSPLYTRHLRFTADTRLRAKAYDRNGNASPELDTYYDVRPAGTIGALESNSATHHLAGMAGSEHLFKLNMKGDERSLTISTEGGTGKTELLVRFGAPPTAKAFDHKASGKGTRATVAIEQPGAGDWYVAVRGRSNFSGVSLLSVSRAAGVDLIAWQPALQPYISEETFSESDCEVQEGMTTAGTHTLLRFNTETRNIGASDLVMPSPVNNPAFEFAECHGHYHFKGFARYRLLDSAGLEVATGRKVSFCLLDLSRWDPKANRISRFTCEEQGIQSGWADIYDSGLPGQWIDITGLSPGAYTLEVTMNPEHVLPESDYSNNTATVGVVIE